MKHLPWLYHRDHSRADSSQIKMKVGFTASEATNDAALGIIRTLPFKLSAYAVSPRSAGPARTDRPPPHAARLGHALGHAALLARPRVHSVRCWLCVLRALQV